MSFQRGWTHKIKNDGLRVGDFTTYLVVHHLQHFANILLLSIAELEVLLC